MSKYSGKTITSSTLVKSKIFSVEQREIEIFDSENPGSTQKVVRDLVIHRGAAVILPLCDDGNLLMIEQYRFAVNRELLEFPAGTLEEEEEIVECAKRELAEETNFQAEEWRKIGTIFPVPGYCCEEQHLFFASKLIPTHAIADPDEIISTRKISIEQFEKGVISGLIQDAKTLTAFFMARLQGLI